MSRSAKIRDVAMNSVIHPFAAADISLVALGVGDAIDPRAMKQFLVLKTECGFHTVMYDGLWMFGKNLGEFGENDSRFTLYLCRRNGI